MDVSPKVAQIEQLANMIETIITNANSLILINSHLVGLEQGANALRSKNNQAAAQIQAIDQYFTQTKLILTYMDQVPQVSAQISSALSLWANIKTDITENVLPGFSADTNVIVRQVIAQIDYNWEKIAGLSFGSIICANAASSNLRLLAAYIKNPPTLLSKDILSPIQKTTASPEQIKTIFSEGAKDTEQQISYYSWAGWAALLFGLMAVIGAVIVPFKWDIPTTMQALPFVSALIARLLAIGVLVYIATILLQRHRDMVHLAARTREFRAHIKMISAVPFFGGDKDSTEALTNILKQLREKPAESTENTEKGFFLPAELMKTLIPMFEKLTGK